MQYRQTQQMNAQYQQSQQMNPQYQAVQQVQAEAAPQQPAGEQQKRQRTGKKKSRVILAVVLSLLGLAAAAALTIFLLLPTINYSRAEKAMDDKDYDTAHEIFASLNGFKDSEDRANDALYRKAKALLKDKKYDEAAEQFRALGSYSDAKEMVQEASYQKGLSLMEQKDYEAACEIFQELGSYSEAPDRLKAARYQIAEKYMDDENYREAYLRFTDLGDYNDSKERVTAALLLWEASVLGGGDTSKADDFAKTVKLNSDQYEDYYSTILLFLTGHEEAEFFYDPYYRDGLTDEALSARKLLSLLPSTYEDTQTLIDLFDAMEYADYCRLFPDNETLMRECFSIPFVRDLAMDDYQIIGFLEGRWTGGGYYLQFDEDRYSSYDLPWVAEPEGAAYYSIENGIFYFDNENNDHLAEVYSFTIVDYDTIQVYCYKDGYTYTMRR